MLIRANINTEHPICYNIDLVTHLIESVLKDAFNPCDSFISTTKMSKDRRSEISLSSLVRLPYLHKDFYKATSTN
jgi:hypothetical protein